MGETETKKLDLKEKFWDTFDLLTKQQALTYIWMTRGDLINDIVRDWDDDVFEQEIEYLQTKLKEGG